MRFLNKLERLIESTMEGSASAVFRQKLTPVEIESRLEQAMIDHSQPSHGGRIVPNAYLVTLHPESFEASIGTLDGYNRRCELFLNQVASQREYTLLHPRITVNFDTDEQLGKRDVRVHASFEQPRADDRFVPPSRAEVEHTRVFSPPPSASTWFVQVLSGDMAGQRFPLSTGMTSIGRGSGNDIALADKHVSRRHAIFEVTGSGLHIRDIGSSNGTSVNGHDIPEATLHAGDTVKLAGVTLRVEHGNMGWS